MFDLTGRIALVTGASGGLGQAIARALHAQGASVALTGTRREALETLAAELETRAHAAPCDLSDTAAVEALIPAVESALGPIDILVNNAGVTRDSLFIRMKDEDWDTVLAINLTAAFRLSRAVAERHAETALWPNHKHNVGCRRPRQCGTRELRRREGRHDRHVQGARRRGRDAGHHCQLHRARLHRQSNDSSFGPETARHDPRHDPDWTFRLRQGNWRSGRVFSEFRIGLCDRADAACERRNGDDLMARTCPQDRGATGFAPSRVAQKDMLSTPFVAGRGRGASSERRRRRTRANLSPHRGGKWAPD